MFVEEGADILLIDSPADDTEVDRAIEAAGERPSLVVLTPGLPRATPTQTEAAKMGFKIGVYPTALLSPAIAGMNAGLQALANGELQAKNALDPAELRQVLGYSDYETEATRFRENTE